MKGSIKSKSNSQLKKIQKSEWIAKQSNSTNSISDSSDSHYESNDDSESEKVGSDVSTENLQIDGNEPPLLNESKTNPELSSFNNVWASSSVRATSNIRLLIGLVLTVSTILSGMSVIDVEVVSSFKN